MVGAITAPLPATTLIVTAIVVLAWVWAVQFTWARPALSRSFIPRKAETLATRWGPPIVLLLLAAACSYPGGRIVDWIVWLAVIAAYWMLLRWRRQPARRSSPATVHSAAEPPSHDNELVLQQLSRFRTADGHDVVRGMLVAEFAPGERTVTLHAAFCPPFERLPHVEAEADETAATIRVSQVLHNGVRLEVRLAKPSDVQRHVCIELAASEIPG